MQLKKFTDDIQRWFNAYFTPKPLPLLQDRFAITFTKHELSWTHVHKTEGRYYSFLSDTLSYDDFSTVPLVLSGIVKKNKLEDVPTFLLLHPDDYQLFLLDTLPVKKEEFQEALKWRIKEFITYPPEEAVADHFLLPPLKSQSAPTMMAVVVSRITVLQPFISLLKKSGLNLSGIDIPELALRNLTALHEEDEKSSAFVYFYENTAILTITRQKTLYFTHTLNVTNQDEEIALEIQRYFDYFQNQWRYPSPGRMFVGSYKNEAEEKAQQLSKYLSISIEPYKSEQKAILTMACAMREGSEHAAAGN